MQRLGKGAEDPSGTWGASFASCNHIFEDKWGNSKEFKARYSVCFLDYLES